MYMHIYIYIHNGAPAEPQRQRPEHHERQVVRLELLRPI